MNETELYLVFQGQIGLLNQIFFGYISLMTGFLVMSYLVADKISNVLTIIAVALFSTVSLMLTARIFLTRNDSEALMTYMLEQKRLGNFDLTWLGTNPDWAAGVMTVFDVGTTVGGFLGCITYFFYKRNNP